MFIKRIIKRLVYGSKSDSRAYVKHLKQIGMSIGDRVVIYEPRSVCIDETRPYLVSIGNDVKITRGVTILTHGYDWSVLAGVYACVLGSAGKVSISDNVFIGMNATILKGVSIGKNVIVGANSLVNKNIPDNCVVAGNPAKIICSIEDYYSKRKAVQKEEAFEMYASYVQRFGVEPTFEIYDEFFWLFQKRNEEIPPQFLRQMTWHDNFENSLRNFKSTDPDFQGYEAFLTEARKYYNKKYTNS